MSYDPESAASVVQIDEHALDKECIRLPSDYLKYANLAADAKRDADEAKTRLDVVQADLAAEVRSNPSDFGLDKVTEAGIQGAVLTNERYQKVLTRVQKARHAQELAQAVVWALEHKKRTLTLLVELHGMGYFAAPKISEKGREAVEKMTQRNVRKFQHEE